MALLDLLDTFDKKTKKLLAKAKTAEELQKIAAESGHALSEEDANAVFAAFYPLRGIDSLSDEDLELAAGGVARPSDEYVRGSRFL